MFVRSLVALALTTLSLSASVPLAKRTGKDHWWSGLETYDAYHARYMELDCNAKHNTNFFDKCCHPRLKNADISKIDDECLGSADCDDEDDNNNSGGNNNDKPTSAPVPAPAPSPSPSKAPVNAEPAPSDEPKPAPAPTTTHHTTTAKPKPTSNPGNGDNGDGNNSGSSGGGGNVKTGSGKGTYFLQNGVAGACGIVHPDSFHVVALDYRLYGNTSQKSQYCGKTIHITNTDNGKTVDAIVGDACPTCESSGSVDMSEGAFTQIATKAQGEVNIKWTIDL